MQASTSLRHQISGRDDSGSVRSRLPDKICGDGLFEDDEFPADWSVLPREMLKLLPSPQLLKWKRPGEICRQPMFVSGGTSRFDVRQGMLGDCWLLSAVASLSLHRHLFNRVVPQGQEFNSADYRGVFRFRFWRYGEWQEVVIDDRLPTYGNQLVFMHSTDTKEFWSALLEKAYAKAVGGYASLIGGNSSEAMEDFTGGVAELFELKAASNDGDNESIFDAMIIANRRCSLMGCGITAGQGQLEVTLANGLIVGHAYSVTGVETVSLATGGCQRLVRVRNPWGNEEEWRGRWSDSSIEWSLVGDEEKRRIGLADADDGEFWMSFEDFVDNFHKLEICNLGPETAAVESEEESGLAGVTWLAVEHHGCWRRNVNAGGCRKFLDTFWLNPQYKICVVDTDEQDEEDVGVVVIGLMQKYRRRRRAANLYIGYMLYPLPADNENSTDNVVSTMPKEFFKYTLSCGRSAFADSREVTGRHRLVPGNYIVVPSTFDPNEEAEFLLRVYSERRSTIDEMDETLSDVSDVMVHNEEVVEDSDGGEQQRRQLQLKASEAFEQMLDSQQQGMELDELAALLNQAFTKSGPRGFAGFSTETCRSLLAFADVNQSGCVQLEELQTLWRCLRRWSAVFKAFDYDDSGYFDAFELREALDELGYRVPNRIRRTLVLRYAGRSGFVDFDEFVLICVKLRTAIETFRAETGTEAKVAALTIDEFLQATVYT